MANAPIEPAPPQDDSKGPRQFLLPTCEPVPCVLRLEDQEPDPPSGPKTRKSKHTRRRRHGKRVSITNKLRSPPSPNRRPLTRRNSEPPAADPLTRPLFADQPGGSRLLRKRPVSDPGPGGHHKRLRTGFGPSPELEAQECPKAGDMVMQIDPGEPIGSPARGPVVRAKIVDVTRPGPSVGRPKMTFIPAGLVGSPGGDLRMRPPLSQVNTQPPSPGKLASDFGTLGLRSPTKFHSESRYKFSGDFGQELGQGVEARVIKARDLVTNLPVALKMIPHKSHEMRSGSTIAANEIALLQQLKHPQIIQLYGVVCYSKFTCLVLPLARMDLFTWIAEEQEGRVIDERTACNVMRQVLEGVSACHQLGIVHRDIKPENILLFRDMKIRICDFGLAQRVVGPVSASSVALRGTARYMAPEIFCLITAGSMIASYPKVCLKACDVFSCGVLWFVLQVRAHPWDLPSTQCYQYKQRMEAEVPWSESSTWPGPISLMKQLLSPQAANRPTAEQAADKLKRYIARARPETGKQCQDIERQPIPDECCMIG